MAAIAAYPAVIKADGLAAGKGVVIAADEGEARAALEAMLVERRFGEHPVVVEEFLDGDELSVLALCDGETRAPARPGARLQAHRRRRHRPQHGRDGRLLAGRGDRRRVPRARPRRGPPAGARRARAPRHAVPRRALRGADADRGRPEGARVQRALRRSGDAGRAPAAAQRPARPAAARHAAAAAWRAPRCEWDARAAVDRGAGVGAATRRAAPPATRSPASTGCPPGSRSPTRAPPSATAPS